MHARISPVLTSGLDARQSDRAWSRRASGSCSPVTAARGSSRQVRRTRRGSHAKQDLRLVVDGVTEPVSVPKQRKLVVCDLDETLVYATTVRLATHEAFTVGPYYAYLRPHLRYFLGFCASRFDLAVWTSSSEDYADAVVKQVFGSVEHLEFLWSRSRCTSRYDAVTREQYWVKDLKKIRRIGYELKHVIVVDDTAKKHERNYGNLVRVRPFEGQPDDDELLHLAKYLNALVDVDDIRRVEKRGWRYSQILGTEDP